ncbi:cyclic nucleotide-binding domain-containing protein [Methylibium sp.]|uniref:cyclic nucleotide-binding domain-containing protein n=1 Tax=Methylibium sp. TaxID=2067992 RepID=UPI0017E3D85B|nr:cyclic nucleotide-binding domain-containing protein [Methylibium sp.]MBA3589238.1 cyclic nucleotide-binding domain-containing protein [Methylibium sp.]
MQTAARIELLQRMPLFGAIRDDALEFIVEQTRSVVAHAGSFFFRENEPARSMFVLESGRVAVLRNWRHQKLLVRELGQGDCFGEMALMDLRPRSASVRAETDCSALELMPATLLALFERDVEQFALIQMNMGREVCRRLRETDEQLFRVRMGEAPASTEHGFGST